MRVGIIVFPGSNCDHDAYRVSRHIFGLETTFIWHKERQLPPVDLVIVPGGFSYGDYLRSGAIARFSSVMDSVIRFAESGGFVLGICNGFQILCECGLLPGVLLRNSSVRFVCKWVYLRTDNNDIPFTEEADLGQILHLPIAHGEGNYFIEAPELVELERNDQIVFRYTTPMGEVTPESNPNGSANNIAGIVNREGNVLGMMPHPERAAEMSLGGDDGRLLFQSLIHSMS
ncbi:MAG: phosphoribosylformylglycinamidine synthase subunit PurQ [Bacteroidetes bacterium]|nr:phosphoribosylformylglycinamidine synthase subunit PurQ [Bacteroidota bacterium]MCY4223355.1 phosphoribosylformylglycinamidine synthase subunit PurQ [Bacteroidota bacterium]